MRWLGYVIASWRKMLAFCFMGYIFNHVNGPFAPLFIVGAGGLFYTALTRVVPIRDKIMPTDTSSHGSARFASNRDMEASGNVATEVASDRYILGISEQSVPMTRSTRASFPLGLRGLRRRCQPLVTTGAKARLSGGKIDDGHVITIGPAGAGKGIAVVLLNLMIYEWTIIVLDPKGENFMFTFMARLKLGHRICLIDPFGVIPSELRSLYLSRFNPLDAVAAAYRSGDHAAVFDLVASIAEMIIVKEPSEREPHWNDKAMAFLRAAIMFVVYGRGYQDRTKTPLTLGTVKGCIWEYFSSEDGIQSFTKRCQESPYLHAAAGSVTIIAPTERSSVLSTLLRHTDFLDSPNVSRSLETTDFDLADLKTEKVTVYFVLPANQMKAYSRLARLWVGTLLQSMMKDSLTTLRWRVLFMLDEVAQLGFMEPLEQAVALGRGYGIDLWLIFQDIHQIKDMYEQRWESFLANAAVQQFFRPHDLTTGEYISKRLGQSTIQTTSHNRSQSDSSGGSWNHSSGQQMGSGSTSSGRSSGRSDSSGASVQQTGRALLQPDEVMRLPDDQLLIFIAGQYPILARKCSVLNPAVMQALTSVRPVDPPNTQAPVSRNFAPDQASRDYAHKGEQQATGSTAGAMSMSQAHVAEREYTRSRSR